MAITREQLRAARSLIRWGQTDLAEAANISVETVKRIEKAPGKLKAYQRTIDAIRTALESAGVEFIDANGGGPGVRLKNRR